MTRSKTLRGAADDVEVAVRDRVERARVDRDAHASSVLSRRGRRSGPSRRTGARAPMLAARPAAGGASRQKCLATTRAPGAEERSEGLERRRPAPPSRRRAGRRTARVPGGSPRAGRVAQPGQGVRPDDRGAVRRQVRPLEVVRDDPDRAAASRSTNVAWAAPATAPRCRPRRCRRTGRGSVRPGRSGSRIAKSVCLTRSPSGRVPAPGASSRMRARRAGDDPAGVSARVARHDAARRVPRPRGGGASHVRSSAARRRGRGGSSRPSASSSASAWARARTASSWWSRRLSDATRSPGRPLWAKPEHVALAAQLEVLLRQLEAVGSLGDGLEPRRGRSRRRVRDQDAERLDRAAPDPATELVELGQPEPVGALDDHHRRRRARRPRPRRRSCRRARPARRRGSGAISASRSAGFIRPWTRPTRSGASSAVSRTASVSAATAPVGVVVAVAPSSMSGTTTNVEWPSGGLLADLRATSRRARSGARIPVRIGTRPAGGVRRSETSRSA